MNKVLKPKHSKDFLELISTPNFIKLKNKILQYNFDLRIVGGAIRDLLLGYLQRDVDLATNALPIEILYLCHELASETPYQEEVIATHGIRHGTIVIYFNENEQYEITSLDFTIETHGNKLLINQVPDWAADAKRRDFSVNAFSMDLNGVIYDYVGGYEDLKQQRIRFLGDFKKRITNNPILILRFFKLLAKFENPQYNPEYINFIKERKFLLQTIKPDTIKWFIQDIATLPYANNAQKAFDECDIEIGSIVESVFNKYLYQMRYMI